MKPCHVAAASFALLGCPHRQPPVDFHSDAGAPTVLADVSAADVSLVDVQDASVFATVQGSPATGDGRSITIAGQVLNAPDGQRFGVYLAVDLDGDGALTDVVATELSADGAAVTHVGMFRRSGTGFAPLAVTGIDVSDPRCTDTSLTLTSPRSLVVGFHCAGVQPGDGGVPPAFRDDQVLVGLGPAPSVKFHASLLPDLPGETATLSLEGKDCDGDGRDDIVVRVGAAAPGRPSHAEARMVMFDRAGGPARDINEPAASLGQVVTAARRQVTGRRSGASNAVAAMQDLGRLRRVLCNDTGIARIRLGSAVGMDCTELHSVFAQGAEVLARGWIAQGELPAAYAETRPQTAGDLGVASSERLLDDLERAAAPERHVTATEGPAVAQPLDGVARVRVGVLSLVPPNAPIAVQLNGPVTGQLELATLTFSPGTPGDVASLLPRSANGALSMVGFAETCDGVQAVLCPASVTACNVLPGATFLPVGVRLERLAAEPSLAMAARCVSTPGSVSVDGPDAGLRVLGWNRVGPVFSWNGRLYRGSDTGAEAVGVGVTESLGTGFRPGGGVSAGGAAVVINAPEGVWVRSQRQWHRWAPSGLAGRYGQLTDVTVSDDGRTVVGILEAHLWVLEQSRLTR